MIRCYSLVMLLIVCSCLLAPTEARLGSGLQLLAVNGVANSTDSSTEGLLADSSSSSVDSLSSSMPSPGPVTLPDRQSRYLSGDVAASNVVGSSTLGPNSSSQLISPVSPSPAPQGYSQAMLTLLQRFRRFTRAASPSPSLTAVVSPVSTAPQGSDQATLTLSQRFRQYRPLPPSPSPTAVVNPVPLVPSFEGAALLDSDLFNSTSSSTNSTTMPLLTSGGQQGQPAANSAASSFPVGASAATSNPSVQGQSTNFQRAPSTTFVQPGETLVYRGVVLSQLADLFSYNYQPSQPYINQAVGYVLWPSIALAPNATVTLQDVQASYINPSLLDTCQEYTFKQLGGLQASLGTAGVTALNGTAIKLDGPVTVDVLVQDGQQQSTIGTATANFNNVVFTCLPNPQEETGLAVPDMGFGPGAGPSMGPGSGQGPGQGPSTGFGPGSGPNMGPGAGPGAGPTMGPSSGQRPSTGTGFVPGKGPSMSPSSEPGFSTGCDPGIQAAQGAGFNTGAPTAERSFNTGAGSAPVSGPSMAPNSEPEFTDTDFGSVPPPSPEPGVSAP